MSHQLGRQIACGATVRSEASEKLEGKAKTDDHLPMVPTKNVENGEVSTLQRLILTNNLN